MTAAPTVAAYAATFRAAPARVAAAVDSLSVRQRTTAFIPGEWTVAQNVHHLADSHTRFVTDLRLALTEERPQLKSYQADAFAVLPDAQSADFSVSLQQFAAVQARLALLIEQLTEAQLARTSVDTRGERTIAALLEIFAHHPAAHITQITATLTAAQE
ncbi:MAG: hypothetical protein RLZZ297_16 [Chloroflexota bacterium]|jgi:uncharacterized damage-inducible protein DinB